MLDKNVHKSKLVFSIASGHVDTLFRDGTSEISHDPHTKCL